MPSPALPAPTFDARRGKFCNAIPTRQPKPLAVIAAMLRERAVKFPTEPLPVEHRRHTDFDSTPAGVRMTWLGHSTFILDVEGARFLVDPVWSKRASPWGWLGPKRFFEPPLPLAELPRIDAVLLSHDHYDHLDEGTIRDLIARGHRFVVPTGVKARLLAWGASPERIDELTWWNERTIDGVRVVATPARHFSGRSPVFTDRDASLWCGYAVIGESKRAWYAGDSSMFDGFATIGAELGPFDLSCIEIGAYSHLWADVHIGPEQAIDAHVMARGGLFVPLHWGTFNLALHGWTEPIERLLVAAERAGVTVAVPRPGGIVDSAAPPAVERWWPSLPWRTAEEYPIVSSGGPFTSSAPGSRR